MKKAKVFMIMPFTDVFFEVYEMLRLEFMDKYEFSNATNVGNQQNILRDIIQPLYETDVVIADLTGLNPNVLYELGVAHTFNKKTIVITQDDLSKLPFDLKQYRAKEYTTHFKSFAELLEYMKSNLHGAISGDVVYSNPVKDFMGLNGINNIPWFSNEKITIDIDSDSDKGLIDFVADIEEDMDNLNKNIDKLIENMNHMTDGINKTVVAIERANNRGGSGNATLVQIEAKKAAGYINDFSAKLKEHNKHFSELWNKIEKNTLGLLENPYAAKGENKTDMVLFIRAIKTLQKAINVSIKSIEGMKDASLGNLGIERTLSQSVRFLDTDLKTHLEIMDFMSVSIDKIIYKSKFIVGDIDFSDIANEDV